MSLCTLCNSRKGKRACPGIRGTICSACCGDKRIVEIACPADCVYLQSGTENDLLREASDYLKHQDPEKCLRWLRAVEELGFLLEGMETLAAQAHGPSFDDSDLRAVLECARKTLDAEAKGVIYEDLPPSPGMQTLTRDLVSGIRVLTRTIQQELRNGVNVMRSAPSAPSGSSGAAAGCGAAEAAYCLQVLVERCDYHLEKTGARDSFIAHLRRVHPPSPPSKGGPGADEGPRILLA